MTQYSSGPFMKMSPSGAPGLLIVVGVVFGGLALFTPRDFHPFLLAIALPVCLVILVVGLHSAYGSSRGSEAPTLFGSDSSPALGHESEDPRSIPQRLASAVTELGVTLTAILLTGGIVLIITSGGGILEFSRLSTASVTLLGILVGLFLSLGIIRFRRSLGSQRGSDTSLHL